ncbi:endothelin-converting enzyme homolog [Leptinotarsa decemlineata]|uniref:endothelin-converting enzyme homolog n=1 Tax=Leptinotarsa decemlineata TaxID=7539 RepID=UPI003D3082DB
MVRNEFHFKSNIIGKKRWKFNESFIWSVTVLSFVNQGYVEGNEECHLKLCTSNECLRAAANLKLSMDPEVDPCDDFYKYACGKWSDVHPNIRLDPTYDAYDSIDDKIAVATKKILMEEYNLGEPRALQKSRSLYWSCTDMDSRNILGLAAMYTILKKVKLPFVPHYILKKVSERENFTFNWMKSETLIKRYFGMDVFIGARVAVNSYNVSQNIIEIGSISENTILPSPDYPKDEDETSSEDEEERSGNRDESDKNSKKKSQKWIVKTNIIKYILTQVTMNKTGTIPSDSVLENAVDAIKEIESFLEEIYLNYTLTGEEDSYSITLEYLQSQTDDYLSTSLPNFWPKYIKYLFSGSHIKIRSKNLSVYTTTGDFEYLNLVLEYLSTTPDINIELYMWWVTVEKMILSTSSDIIYYVTKETNDSYETYAGSEEQCISIAKKYMGYAITYALAEELYPNTTKPKVGQMLKRLKTAFENHVTNLDWMDNTTKKVTLQKSREMISFLGYPDWLFEKGALDKYYDGLKIITYTYLENLVNRISHYNLDILNSFNKTHKRSWYNDAFDESEPISANAFYSAKDNAMDIPMGLLTFPMYDLGLEVLNYGALVTTLGHELTHGFDNRGRQRDKYGNYRQWWSNSTIEAFTDLVECFVEQFNNFTVEGVKPRVDGERTLSENVADNGGLNQAFSAYKSFQETSPKEPKLPGFENFSDDEMFFIAYASTWCKTTTKTALEMSLTEGNYAPFSVRLLASLQNSEDFSRVFNCSVGSFMNPEKKCRIW